MTNREKERPLLKKKKSADCGRVSQRKRLMSTLELFDQFGGVSQVVSNAEGKRYKETSEFWGVTLLVRCLVKSRVSTSCLLSGETISAVVRRTHWNR